jgi:DNA-binding response OmpR family regulator
MKGYHLDDVHLLLADRNWEVRESVKGWLRHVGFGTVSATDKLADLVAWISEEAPDLLISDIDLADGDPCELFAAIRYNRVGENPFLPIIALSISGDHSTVRKVIDTGADDLLMKPICMELLFERITALIRRRKPFVVTSDYIGPSRRRQARGETDGTLLEVPNSLKAKAIGNADVTAIQEEITKAVAEVNEQRMERHVDRIEELVRRIVGEDESGRGSGDRSHCLAQLLEVAQDLGRRMIDTRFAHVSDLCRSLVQLATVLIQTGDSPNPRDIRVLPHLAEAIRAAFNEKRETVAIAHDISQSVAQLAAK